MKDIELATNSVKAYIDPAYNMGWSDQHMCKYCYPGDEGCDVSAQCCITQEPYC